MRGRAVCRFDVAGLGVTEIDGSTVRGGDGVPLAGGPAAGPWYLVRAIWEFLCEPIPVASYSYAKVGY